MIEINDDGTIKTCVFASPAFDMERSILSLRLTQVKLAHYSETEAVEVAREAGYKTVVLTNDIKVDPETRLIVTAPEFLREGLVGAFDFATSLSLASLGEPGDSAMQMVGEMIEEFLVSNSLV